MKLFSGVLAAFLLSVSMAASAETPAVQESLYQKAYKAAQDEQRKNKRQEDWANFGRYAKENQSAKPDVVFMGNSITNNWFAKDSTFFQKNNLSGRGISGQVSSQMLVRFRQDVIDLHPKAVVILSGTNDIARNGGTISLNHILDNVKSMCELARVNNIDPIICSVLPCVSYRWARDIKPAGEIVKLNKLLKDYAAEANIPYVDFYTNMADERGGLPSKYTYDECHPTLEGYHVMEKIIIPYISKYLSH